MFIFQLLSCEYYIMMSILNTSKANTCIKALNIIIKNMNNSSLYVPLAYQLCESGCSCCRAEYFYLICKIVNEYKIYCYNGIIKHTNICAIIRCSCNEPFTWKNINPVEKDFCNINIEHFVSINDDTWRNDFKMFCDLQQENNDIKIYNDDNDDEDISLKNYSFYFAPSTMM